MIRNRASRMLRVGVWFGAAAVVGLFGCYYDVEATLYGGKCPEAIESYDASIRTIVQSNCTVCHSGSAPDAGLDLTTYANVRQASLEGPLLEVLQLPASDSRSMPPNGSLDSCKIALIKNWVAAGAPEF